MSNSTALSDDFMGNIAMLTQSLQQLNNAPIPPEQSRIDLSGTEGIPTESSIVYNAMDSLNQIPTESSIAYNAMDSHVQNYMPKQVNFGEEEVKRLEKERQRETDRLLESKVQVVNKNDVHGEFKYDVKELAKIEDMVNEYNVLIRKLKKKKDELRQKTIDHMMEYKIDTAKMKPDGSDKFNLIQSQTVINPTTKARLPEKLYLYFKEEENMSSERAEEKSKKIFKWLYDTADKKTVHSLRRYKKK